ncbi:uncharacterized protein LOC144641315, partial [Oculina patagonica]
CLLPVSLQMLCKVESVLGPMAVTTLSSSNYVTISFIPSRQVREIRVIKIEAFIGLFTDRIGERESRFRKRTAKGREFHIELMKDQWTAAQRAWRKQLNKIENLLTDSNEITPLISERNLLETKMEILSEAHERLDDALEDDYETKRVVQEKYETWEREHSDALKRVNSRVTELKQERESTKSTATKSSRSSRRSSNDSRASKSSTLERKVDSAAKVAKLKTDYCRCCMLSTFVDAEVERTAALKRQEDELRKFQLTKKLALAKAEMDAITKIEESESVISDEDRKDVLPVDVIDNRDLLNEYL